MTAPALADALLDRCTRHATGAPWPPRDAETWRRAYPLLAFHGLAPLAAHRAAHDCADEAVARSLVWAERRARLTQATVLRWIANLHGRFERAGVRYAVLKGVHLYATLYGDDFPRPYGDVDLLVARGDLDRAIALLGELGYEPAGGAFSQRFQRRFHFHLVLRPAHRSLPDVELHWALEDRANLHQSDDAGVLARAEPVGVTGATFRAPSREDTLLYLCLHMAKHAQLNPFGIRTAQDASWFCSRSSGNRLIWVADLGRLLAVHGEHLDWDEIAARARSWNVADELATGLAVLARVGDSGGAAEAGKRLGLALPAASPRRSDALLAWAGTRRTFQRAMDMREDVFFRPARVLFLLGVLFPPRDSLARYWSAWPRSFVPLLRMLHPFAIAWRLLHAPGS